jgi:4-amino-4-deoxy-L-arabinose transferase-like glycosyltransferase
VAQVAALVLLVLGLLPIANWIPGGHDAPWYPERMTDWITGTGIVVGVAIVVLIVLRSRPNLWRSGVWARVAGRWRRGDRRADTGIAIAVLAVCAVVSRMILSAKPLMIDEITQLFQARIFATGHLYRPAAQFPEFTSTMQLIDWSGKVYSQFPAGGPAMLAIGTLAHAAWLVGPLATAIGVYLFARLLRRLGLGDGTALAALLLYAFAPFVLFLGGSMMNEVTETTWLLAAALALMIATSDAAPNGRAAFVAGLALGVAASIRPADAVAFALPAAAWLLWRARWGMPHLRVLLWSGVGIAIPLTLMLWVNTQQTGHALRFGYVEMWGASHELGFHAAPWGDAHTPARGLELINLYFLQLQDFLYESAAPSLLFATIALALAPRVRGFDRWILTGSFLLIGAYFAYWHDGFYLGPRFMLPLAPWLALWTARLPAMMATRGVRLNVVQATVAGGVLALLIGAATSLPIRARQYRNSMLSRRFDVAAIARAHGVHDAIVLVREWWGAQLVARMWALGVTRADAEHFYRWNDACRVQAAIAATEGDQSGAAGLRQRLAAFRDDSAQLMMNQMMHDTTVRIAPGATWTPACLRRLAEDTAGFAVFPSMLLARGDGNVYLRDLHARDTLLLPEMRQHPVWLLTESPEIGGDLRFQRVPLDSMQSEWRAQ